MILPASHPPSNCGTKCCHNSVLILTLAIVDAATVVVLVRSSHSVAVAFNVLPCPDRVTAIEYKGSSRMNVSHSGRALTLSKTGTTSRPVVNTVVINTWRVTRVANNIQETLASDDAMVVEAVEAGTAAAMRFGIIVLVLLDRQSAAVAAASAH